MDVENPNEFLEEKKSKKDKKAEKAEAARSEDSDKPGADRDAENTRSANPSVRKSVTSGGSAKAKSGRS